MSVFVRVSGHDPRIPGNTPTTTLTSPPIFLIPGITGNPFELKSLADALQKKQPERPIYIFQDPRHNDPTATWNFDQLCTAIKQEMYELAPEGPYCIVGYSLGATLAIQVAQQIEQEQYHVAAYLIDQPAPALSQAYLCPNNPLATADLLAMINYVLYLCGHEQINIPNPELAQISQQPILQQFLLLTQQLYQNDSDLAHNSIAPIYLKIIYENIASLCTSTIAPASDLGSKLESLAIATTSATDTKYNGRLLMSWEPYAKPGHLIAYTYPQQTHSSIIEQAHASELANSIHHYFTTSLQENRDEKVNDDALLQKMRDLLLSIPPQKAQWVLQRARNWFNFIPFSALDDGSSHMQTDTIEPISVTSTTPPVPGQALSLAPHTVMYPNTRRQEQERLLKFFPSKRKE